MIFQKSIIHNIIGKYNTILNNNIYLNILFEKKKIFKFLRIFVEIVLEKF
jgi:hypothetical protein